MGPRSVHGKRGSSVEIRDFTQRSGIMGGDPRRTWIARGSKGASSFISSVYYLHVTYLLVHTGMPLQYVEVACH